MSAVQLPFPNLVQGLAVDTLRCGGARFETAQTDLDAAGVAISVVVLIESVDLPVVEASGVAVRLAERGSVVLVVGDRTAEVGASVVGAELAKADLVIGAESRGFIFGTAVAQALSCGFVPVRKPGKLPAATIRRIDPVVGIAPVSVVFVRYELTTNQNQRMAEQDKG